MYPSRRRESSARSRSWTLGSAPSSGLEQPDAIQRARYRRSPPRCGARSARAPAPPKFLICWSNSVIWSLRATRWRSISPHHPLLILGLHLRVRLTLGREDQLIAECPQLGGLLLDLALGSQDVGRADPLQAAGLEQVLGRVGRARAAPAHATTAIATNHPAAHRSRTPIMVGTPHAGRARRRPDHADDPAAVVRTGSPRPPCWPAASPSTGDASGRPSSESPRRARPPPTGPRAVAASSRPSGTRATAPAWA